MKQSRTAEGMSRRTLLEIFDYTSLLHCPRYVTGRYGSVIRPPSALSMNGPSRSATIFAVSSAESPGVVT